MASKNFGSFSITKNELVLHMTFSRLAILSAHTPVSRELSTLRWSRYSRCLRAIRFDGRTCLPISYSHVRRLQYSSYGRVDDGLRLGQPGDVQWKNADTRASVSVPSKLVPADSTAQLDQNPVTRRETVAKVKAEEFPVVCPGCGAYSQTASNDAPGYYTAERKDIRLWLAKQRQVKSEEDEETDLMNRSLAGLDSSLAASLGIEASELTPKQKVASITPLCGRCHALVHYNDLQQKSIIHPTIRSVKAFLDESPHRRNHIYHVVDAADFPMSLIPNISSFFDIAVRSKNRRAQSGKWSNGQNNRMSFIITRADLIANKQRDLDRMMPYLQDVLRDALGKHGENIRLGNIWCVSARQAWWTKQLKEEVYENGGGGWLVGKVNVGKSQLYEAIFPKGHKTDLHEPDESEEHGSAVAFDDSHPLLPPVPAEEKYPPMPTVSQLPGTTALPVRNFYGNGRGELIDLPGLPRNGLYEAVDPRRAPYLYHGRRISAEQITVLPGNSLLLGNLVQIKATHPMVTILAAPFVPMSCSARENELAQSILNQTRPATSEENKTRSLARPEVAETIRLAGTFKLAHNVTKARTGPLTRRDAAHLQVSALPFEIFGTDILIEGVGWVELSCQVRKRFLEEINDPTWRPEVEVFSPNGKYIGVRRPMNAYLTIGARRKPKSQRSQRPRRSMKGVKKEQKRMTRENHPNTASGNEG